MTAMRRGVGRLIDSYAEGVIDKAEFGPRIAGLKQRLSQLQERHQAALEAAEIERGLSLVISRLEDFSAKVATRLDDLDRAGMQDIIRILVRRIEIDDARIEVIFRVPPPDGPSRPSPTDQTATWQHCTGVGRTNSGLDQSRATPVKGFRGYNRVLARMAAIGRRLLPYAKAREGENRRCLNFESGSHPSKSTRCGISGSSAGGIG
jgi:site-specific DNA recombinase